MKKIRLLQLFLLIFIINFNGFGQSQEYNADKNIDTFITSQMKTLGIPGMAVAVVKNGKIMKVTTYGFANLEWDRKVTTQSTFQIASTTKLITSTLLLKTLFNGKINLDDPIEKYLDSIPSAWKNIQIKHLISHSSGLREYKGDMYASTAAVVKALKDSLLEYIPGRGQKYAQADFMLLGYIFEKIYGKPFTKLLADEITVPLKMNDGGYDMEQKTDNYLRTKLIKEKVTTYYDYEGKIHAYKFMYPQYYYTAGGYFASINDLVNWAIGLDKEILFTKAFSEEYIYGKDSIGNKLSTYTKAGWILENENGIQYAGHSGGPGLADIIRFPNEGYTFIVLTNDGEILPYFARAIATFYLSNLPGNQKIEKFDR